MQCKTSQTFILFKFLFLFSKDAYHNKFPFVISSKLMNGLTSGGTIMEHLFNSSKNFAHPNPPYAMFPVENQSILNDDWVWDIIYDSELAESLPPFLLTLDHNDEMCLLEPIDDSQIVKAVGFARTQRQKRLINRGNVDDGGGGSGRDSKPDWSNEIDLTGTGSNVLNDDHDLEAACARSKQSQFGLTTPSLPPPTSSNPMMMVDGSSKNANNCSNRTSLQVSFGMASTRGMFTGALAKTGKTGAEKVKMILGKVSIYSKIGFILILMGFIYLFIY